MDSTMDEINQLLHGENEQDDTEYVEAAAVLKQLETIWLNEKFSPELLPNRTDIVDCVMEQLELMQDNIERSKKVDIKISLHRMEIDRIRFMLSSYLRTRLQKIEKYTNHILQQEADESKECLSPEELKYAKEYGEITLVHLNKLALKNMPLNLQELKSNQKIIKPNLDTYVFLKANEEVEGILVDEETSEQVEEIVNMEINDQYIVRYKPVAAFVEAGALSLI